MMKVLGICVEVKKKDARIRTFVSLNTGFHVTTNNPPGLHSEVLVAGGLCSSVFNGRRLPDLDCFLVV